MHPATKYLQLRTLYIYLQRMYTITRCRNAGECRCLRRRLRNALSARMIGKTDSPSYAHLSAITDTQVKERCTIRLFLYGFNNIPRSITFAISGVTSSTAMRRCCAAETRRTATLAIEGTSGTSHPTVLRAAAAIERGDLSSHARVGERSLARIMLALCPRH